MAEAKMRALAITDESLNDYYLSIEKEKLIREFQQKENRDKVIILAAEQLQNRKVDNKTVSKDWITQFLIDVENISDEEMQLLFAKLLAGEIQKPGSFSRRTISTLKLMTPEEARLFYLMAMYSFKNEKGQVLLPSGSQEYLSSSGLSFKINNYDGELLEAINLISNRNRPKTVVFSPSKDKSHIWISNLNHGIRISGTFGKELSSISLQGQRFTYIGEELIELVSQDIDVMPYLRKNALQIIKNSYEKNAMNFIYAQFGKVSEIEDDWQVFEESEKFSWDDIT